MDRRSFLRLGASALPALVIRVGAPTLSVAAVARLADPPSVSAQPWLVPLIGAVGQFAIATLSPAISRKVDEWLNGKSPTERTQVESVHSSVAGRGFTNLGDSTPVYSPRDFDVAYYGIPHRDGFNAFAPFYDNQGLATLAEGPAIFGLALAANDWQQVAAVSRQAAAIPAADALVPIAAYDVTPWNVYAKPPVPSRGLPFFQSWPNPVVYETREGGVVMYYQAYPQGRTGEIRVSVVDPDGRPWTQNAAPIYW